MLFSLEAIELTSYCAKGSGSRKKKKDFRFRNKKTLELIVPHIMGLLTLCN